MEDQGAIQYISNAPKNNMNDENKPTELAETAGNVIDLKKTIAATATHPAAKKRVKKYRNLARKKPFKKSPDDTAKINDEDINNLDTITKLEPGKNAQIAANKISKKYEKIRAKKRKIILVEEPEEIVVLLPQKREDPLKTNTYIAAKKISNKYKIIRQANNISITKDLQETASKKKAQIAARKISEKYKKKMRYKKATLPHLVETDDTENTTYDVRPKKGALITANKIKK